MVTYRPDYVTSTLGTLFRLLFGPVYYNLQFVSCVLGLLWLLLGWRAHRDAWDWGRQAPLLILVSLATTPYGWMFDAVVALPALLSVARTRVVLLPILIYLVINLLGLALNLMGLTAIWYLWFAPALLACYLLATRRGVSGDHIPEAAGTVSK